MNVRLEGRALEGAAIKPRGTGSPLNGRISDRKSPNKMMKSRECWRVWNIRLVGSVRSFSTNIAQFTIPLIISHAELRMIASRSDSFMTDPLKPDVAFASLVAHAAERDRPRNRLERLDADGDADHEIIGAQAATDGRRPRIAWR